MGLRHQFSEVDRMRAKKPIIIGDAVLWRCPTCNHYMPATSFYADKRTSNGLKAQCKACHCRTTIATRDKGKAADANRQYMRNARNRDPLKFRERDRLASRKMGRTPQREARYQLNRAVRRGEVIRPDVCTACGRAIKLTAHHDDYTKPLDVRWLCYECHGKEHRS